MKGFLADRRYVCRICGMRSRLLSNRSLRAANVWFKRQSIPFATCDREGCTNCGVNVFEHSGRYKPLARSRAQCPECTRTFSLGEAGQLSRSLDEPGRLKKRSADIFWHMHNAQGFRDGLKEFEQRFRDARGDNASHYDVLRRNVGMRVRDYQSRSSAAIMAQDCLERLHGLFPRENGGDDLGPEDSPFNGIATLRTDTVVRLAPEVEGGQCSPLPLVSGNRRCARPPRRWWRSRGWRPCPGTPCTRSPAPGPSKSRSVCSAGLDPHSARSCRVSSGPARRNWRSRARGSG